jgi:hypothetical protein
MFGVFICALLMLTALTVYFKAAMNRSYGVTTENGKNSTLSDLVFVKVIDN